MMALRAGTIGRVARVLMTKNVEDDLEVTICKGKSIIPLPEIDLHTRGKTSKTRETQSVLLKEDETDLRQLVT